MAVTLKIQDGDFIDGEINGWPVNVQADKYSGQGWDVTVAPYEADTDCPDEVAMVCRELSDRDYKSVSEVRAALLGVGFVVVQ